MAKRTDFAIEFKLTKETARELHDIYLFHIRDVYDDEHERLLVEHVKDMYLRIHSLMLSMLKTSQKLQMSLSEALAFFQYWNVTDTSSYPLADVLIRDMVAKIDKRIKSPKK